MNEKKETKEANLQADREKDIITSSSPIKKGDNQKITNEDSFVEKWKNHRYLFVRGTYIVLNSIWMVVMAVGMFLAWLIALLAT